LIQLDQKVNTCIMQLNLQYTVIITNIKKLNKNKRHYKIKVQEIRRHCAGNIKNEGY